MDVILYFYQKGYISVRTTNKDDVFIKEKIIYSKIYHIKAYMGIYFINMDYMIQFYCK